MKITGFTIVRNVLQYDYPAMESILSLLPLCDEVVVAVGKSSDETLALIQSIDSKKIRIIETVWDESLRAGGRVLAVETDKAYQAISEDTDWCIYLQADEILHEGDYENIRKELLKYKADSEVEGFILKYRHFYGSYDYIGDARLWYRNEIRILRKLDTVHSYRDAQGFRKADGSKLRVKKIEAFVHHYGWVKHPKYQQLKQKNFNKLWHDDNWVAENVADVAEFDYSQIDSLKKFGGTHPKVMQNRIDAMNWRFSFDPTQKKLSFKNKLLMAIEKWTGWRIGEYRNYYLIK